MATRIKKATNKGMIMIVQALVLLLGVVFVWLIFPLPLAIIIVFVLGGQVEYSYSCSSCGGVVGESNLCHHCNQTLK